jgi:hypothetical protein
MKELLKLNMVLEVDSKKSILLPFLGFTIIRDVDIDICGCKVNFFLRRICIIKTRGKLNFIHWRGKSRNKQSWLTTGSSKKLFPMCFFCAAKSSVFLLIVQKVQCF